MLNNALVRCSFSKLFGQGLLLARLGWCFDPGMGACRPDPVRALSACPVIPADLLAEVDEITNQKECFVPHHEAPTEECT